MAHIVHLPQLLSQTSPEEHCSLLMVFQYQSSQSIIDTIEELKLVHLHTQYLFWRI